jgi:hypothetical protein
MPRCLVAMVGYVDVQAMKLDLPIQMIEIIIVHVSWSYFSGG